MPKYYFTRDSISGEPILFHTAPGADEIHVPSGERVEDFEHLIPVTDLQEMPQPQFARHPFWDSYIGRFMGGDSGSATWRMVQICIAIWGIYQFVGTAKSTLEEIHTDTRKVDQHELHLDTLRRFEQALGSPRNIETYQSATNLSLKIANKHFPKDVQEYQQQMQWSAGANSFRVEKDGGQ